jgi:transcriptional regulator with XRE-family HTH domain
MSLTKEEVKALAQLDEVEALYKLGLTQREVAAKLGVASSTVWRRRDRGREIRERVGDVVSEAVVPRELPSFERWDLPGEPSDDLGYDQLDDDVPIEDLINDRKERFKRLDGKKTRRHTRKVQVKIPGPVAITHFGDPHVDDDGCNWPELLRTVEVVSKTEGMFAGNIGDTTNNWVGRLQRLWGHQSTTVDEAIRLAHWLFHSVPWMYCVLGNHDKWNHGAQLLRYLTQGAKIAVFAEEHGPY